MEILHYCKFHVIISVCQWQVSFPTRPCATPGDVYVKLMYSFCLCFHSFLRVVTIQHSNQPASHPCLLSTKIIVRTKNPGNRTSFVYSMVAKPTGFMRYVATFVNYEYVTKIAQKFRRLGIPLFIIFPSVAGKPDNNSSCGPLLYRVWTSMV